MTVSIVEALHRLTPSGRGMGDRRDRHFADAHPNARAFFGARAGLTVGAQDYSAFVDRVRDQSTSSACVGMTLARVAHCRAQIERFGLRAPNPAAIPYPSELGIYKLAREEEAADGTTPLVDEGTNPASADMALREVGIPLERDEPFDLAKINERVSPDVLARSLSIKLTGSYLIDSGGAQKVEDMRRALDLYGPIPMAILVGDNYEAGSPDPNTAVPAEAVDGKIYGGHEIAIVGYRTAADGKTWWLNCGSWGTSWGFGGYSWLAEEWATDPRTSNVRVVTVVNDFSLVSLAKEIADRRAAEEARKS